jgi:hypothetical protein
MWSRFAAGFIMTVAIVLMAQPAMAGTRVYVNFGFPVIGLGYRAYHGPAYVVRDVPPCPPPERVYVVHEYMPYPYRIWVSGYRHWDGSRHVWVPGHWETVTPRHAPEYRDYRDRDNHNDRYNDRDRFEDRD